MKHVPETAPIEPVEPTGEVAARTSCSVSR